MNGDGKLDLVLDYVGYSSSGTVTETGILTMFGGGDGIRQGKMPKLQSAKSGSDFYFVARETPEKNAATLVMLIQNRIPSSRA